MYAANQRIRKNDRSDYCRQKGIGEKTVKITGQKNLIIMIQIAFKLIIIQFLSIHIGKILDCMDRSIWQMNNHFMLIYFCYLLNINMHDLHKHVSFINNNTKIFCIILGHFSISLYLRTGMIK